VSSSPLICLITPGHVSTTPRLVKNADALVEEGYQVHVIASAPFPPADKLDADVVSGARWAYTRANFRHERGAFGRKVIRHLSRKIVGLGGPISTGVAARAQFDESRVLAKTAARIRANLYIGHCLASLPAVAEASRAAGCHYGFDIEDYHDAETESALSDPVEIRIRNVLQKRLLPGCKPLTCSAPMIARRYSEEYNVDPLVLLNVFPLSFAPASPIKSEPIAADRPAVFYWFSQTIGSDRGLEETIAVMAQMQTPVELHLRGFATPSYLAGLQGLATKLGLRRPLRFLPPASPTEMARLAATADLGLSVERNSPLNKDICLANKIFVYLMAGIPQLMTATTAQSSLAKELGTAALVCDLSRVQETAARLDSFFADPAGVDQARKAAICAATERFCWDIEKRAFLEAVKAALPNQE